MKTLLNADSQVEKLGYEKAKELLQGIFKSLNQFYIIDTGCFDVDQVKQGLDTLIKMLNGQIHIVKGEYGYLCKGAKDDFDSNLFHIFPANTPVPELKFRLE